MQIMLYDKDIVNCHDHKVDIVNNGHPVCSLSRLISYPSDGQCVKGLSKSAKVMFLYASLYRYNCRW